MVWGVWRLPYWSIVILTTTVPVGDVLGLHHDHCIGHGRARFRSSDLRYYLTHVLKEHTGV
jgi:hypothetical protein